MPNPQDTRPTTDMFGVPANMEDFYGQMEQQTGDSWINESDPAPQGQPGQPAGADNAPSNDDVRYQYWQSQHDIIKNKYNELEQNYSKLREQVSKIEEKTAPVVEEEEFPEPPQPPRKPYNFSYPEALSDPSSDSAQWMIAMTEYNQNMNQYNLYRSQWVEAKAKEQMESYAKTSQQKEQELMRQAQMSEQVNQVISTVQQKYGVPYETAIDFVNTMSDNSSITIDNLFELYKIRKGVAQGQTPTGRYAPAPTQNQQFNPFGATLPQAQPSMDFQQRQRAQSVPPTMGVHNANVQQYEDPLMTMFRQTIKASNSQNIF